MSLNRDYIELNAHEMVLKNRRTMDLTGIKSIGNFDPKQFILETTMGFLVIHGQEMEMKGFDKEKGTVCIHGFFNTWTYQNEQPGEKTKNFFGKLFK